MIVMKGKYNTANIMIDTIDETTKAQIQSFLNHPAFGNTYIAIMPDCHAGKGAVIGFTMKLNDYIIPNIVGVDIGCGMLAARFTDFNKKVEKLDGFIKKHIPAGFNIHEISACSDSFNADELGRWTERIGMDYNRALLSIGTLGGGNHFIEAGEDSEGQTWITVHSGSRNFGLRIADHFQNRAKALLEKFFIRNEYRELEFLPLDTQDGQDYLTAVRFAQGYASENRKTMMRIISQFMESEPIETIESVHNFIGDDDIIRKGATPADEGRRVIIPFNMRDGIALCTGKGSSKYNFSAPHGAGRILSRSKARAQLSVSAFEKTMADAGIYTTTATEETIDEAPDAYKDMNLIMENIRETVDVNTLIKPFYNFKAGGD